MSIQIERSNLFLRHLAQDLQKQISLKKEPNIYEYNNVLAYLDDDYIISFNQSKNCIKNKEIRFKYPDIENITNNETYIKILEILFHEIGRLFIEDTKKMHPEFEISEFSIDMFVREMLMPEEFFKKEVIKNLNNNNISIMNIANTFNIDYLEVLARGQDLNIF